MGKNKAVWMYGEIGRWIGIRMEREWVNALIVCQRAIRLVDVRCYILDGSMLDLMVNGYFNAPPADPSIASIPHPAALSKSAPSQGLDH
ncbi:hypothetical protein WR25_03549 [Diploscapter pachys]|uniref:Uncharacterized protein n=1 Tax=Diploscapter pachys TaxID=2018661 RepID=A0A2A2K4E0_9BILA|nr:hypothetical protein WR25_03549 [Diploscapter pachys]